MVQLKLRAERRLGELLAVMPKNRGEAGQFKAAVPGGNTMLPPVSQPTLAELGLQKMQAHRLQKAA